MTVCPSDNSTLWIPCSKNYPAIDGVLFLDDAAASFYLQCTATEDERKDDWTTGKKLVVASELIGLWRDKFGDAPLRVYSLVPHARFRRQKVTLTPPQELRVCVYVCALVD
jgi:hypothetical protein